MSNRAKTLPPRSRVKTADTWDLSSLFPDDAAWEKAFAKWERDIRRYDSFRGQLAQGAAELAACLRFDSKSDRAAERLGTYAFLKTSQDTANSDYQRMVGRYQHAASQAAQAASFIRPEILAIPSTKLKKMMGERSLAPFRLQLERLLRYKPHTLSRNEEKLLAMQSEMAGATNKIFRQLTDADMRFGHVRDEDGRQVELSNATFSKFLYSPRRAVRRQAFQRFYDQFAAHENTLAATLAGSVQRDVYYARARGHASARESSLFDDNVPTSVYDHLIEVVHSHLPSLYHYFDLRRRKMKLRSIHHYDTYAPIVSRKKSRYSWSKAVELVLASLEPLGSEYVQVLRGGLEARWCDRYPNRGKQSGAFSCGSFDGDPYILMNYEPELLDHVFTLTHEAGHSMHSYYSAANQPFEYYNYTIFVAEVASTFNEQLLSHHLTQQAKSDAHRAYLINRDIDAIRGTIIRQTMFAEFEKIAHALAESGEPLTTERIRREYRQLLELYFGPDFEIDEQLSLECLRIPHFYNAFYVYQYATGLSAAIALSQRVLNGGRKELGDYMSLLKGGCSKYPLDLLSDAGVDLSQPEPVETALAHFDSLVGELERLL